MTDENRGKSADTTGIGWPEEKTFAFSVFDDTDGETLENARPVYDLLSELGLMTTKSVWIYDHPDAPRWAGQSCEDPEYRAWLNELEHRGVEIGYHGARCLSSPREVTVAALDRFREMFGQDPVTFANHDRNGEGMYWGPARVSGTARAVYQVATGLSRSGQFHGHTPDHPMFWGDVCRERIEYVRNFTYNEINTLKICPQMPYHDPDRPFVNAWFAAGNGADADRFARLLASENQGRLQSEHGACIVHTHFAKGFVRDGAVRPEVRRLLEELAERDGWFVPVATLLRHIREQRGGIHTIAPRERRALEWRWLGGRMLAAGRRL